MSKLRAAIFPIKECAVRLRIPSFWDRRKNRWHNMRFRSVLCLGIAIPAVALVLWPSTAQGPRIVPRPAPGGTRGPSAIAFSRDGRTAFLAEQDTNLIAVLDAESGKLLARIPSGGKEPTGIALAPD